MSSSATTRFSGLSLPGETTARTHISGKRSSGKPETSDESLLTNICAGDRESLAVLFRRYAHLVRNVGQRVLRDKAEADDLVQKVFLYIHLKSSLFDSAKGSASSWIVQVTYTQALLRRRRLKSQGFYMSGITDKPDESDQATNKGADPLCAGRQEP